MTQAQPTPTAVPEALIKAKEIQDRIAAEAKPKLATWTVEDEAQRKALREKEDAFFQRCQSDLADLVDKHLVTMEESSIVLMLMANAPAFIQAIERWNTLELDTKK